MRKRSIEDEDEQDDEITKSSLKERPSSRVATIVRIDFSLGIQRLKR
jgi:hypothetical protein